MTRKGDSKWHTLIKTHLFLDVKAKRRGGTFFLISNLEVANDSGKVLPICPRIDKRPTLAGVCWGLSYLELILTLSKDTR